jgi:hypothetical protein
MTGKIFYAPLTLAGEGKGEGGYNLFPLTDILSPWGEESN